MTIRDKTVLKVAAHLLDSAAPLRTKDAPDPLDTLAKKFGDHVSEVLTKLGATNDQLKTVKEQLAVIEQKAARGGGEPSQPETWGETFAKSRSEDLARVSSERSKTSLELKATISSAIADAAGSAGGLIVLQRDQMVMLPKRRLTIRNLLNVVQVTSGSVEYPKQKVFNNNAAMVAELAAKPESDLQFELTTLPIRVIAHWMKASRQVLDDVPQLKGIIDVELLYGLALKEEAQLLNGDNTGQNLHGMNVQATPYAAPIDVEMANSIDVIGLAILQASLTNVAPDGIVIHPASWWGMRLAKSSDGKYLLGDPMSVVAPNLFGLPVVPTEAQGQTKFLVGSFASQTLYDRWSARVEVGFVNDDFTKNLVTVLGEERVGFAAKQPQALIYGDFDTALAAS